MIIAVFEDRLNGVFLFHLFSVVFWQVAWVPGHLPLSRYERKATMPIKITPIVAICVAVTHMMSSPVFLLMAPSI